MARYSIALTILLLLPALAEAEGRVISGDFEYGEKYTAVFVKDEDADEARDDEEFDRYAFARGWLQYDQEIGDQLNVTLRSQRLDRQYTSRPELNNKTDQLTFRARFEPNKRWAIWPKVSLRTRNYDARPLDNQILDAGIEARLRWGVRNNVRFGVSYTDAAYDIEKFRDRENYSAFVTLEKPFSESTTIKISARVQETRFDVPSAIRENSTKGSGSIGFRHEF